MVSGILRAGILTTITGLTAVVIGIGPASIFPNSSAQDAVTDSSVMRRYHPTAGKEFLYEITMDLDGKGSEFQVRANFNWQLTYNIRQSDASQWTADYTLEIRSASAQTAPKLGLKTMPPPTGRSTASKAGWENLNPIIGRLYPCLTNKVTGTLVVSSHGEILSNSADTSLPARFAQLAELPILPLSPTNDISWNPIRRVPAAVNADGASAEARERVYEIFRSTQAPTHPEAKAHDTYRLSILHVGSDYASIAKLTPMRRGERSTGPRSRMQWYFSGLLALDNETGMPFTFRGGGEFIDDPVKVPGMKAGEVVELSYTRLSLRIQPVGVELEDVTLNAEQLRNAPKLPQKFERLYPLTKQRRDIVMRIIQRSRKLPTSSLSLLKMSYPAWTDQELMSQLKRLNSPESQEILSYWTEISRDAREKPRTWKTAVGSFSVEAYLVKTDRLNVTLRRVENQKEVVVPLDRLSDDDKQFANAFGYAAE
ncbi:hypothetical protein FHS27_003810 [Rhodopirellula rubra]|uniref:SLA1 homology domain-containing protein n=1 Tax=Aporhodopirellula rubra TaxID=980271 RepID=A0A7W5H749_9BACT|nr:SHD1 domain-containing protein [Aporhodopirellula rubra]MBB3207983.1 hypothetical protein [Aporhodopirellula rubra]